MNLPIGELAKRSGVAASALRYYEELGILPHSVRRGGKRWFPDSVMGRLAFIRICQEAGLTLHEVKDLLKASEEGLQLPRAWAVAVPKIQAELNIQASRLVAAQQLLDQVSACACESLEACTTELSSKSPGARVRR